MQKELNFQEKKILVLGLGLHGGGTGTVRYLHKKGARITVTDLRSRSDLRPALRELERFKGIRYVLGRHREEDIRQAELIVKNPGIPEHSSYLALARKHRVPIITDLGIFFTLSPATIIGVTGTRGKSTTCFLIWKFLREKFGDRVFLGGNIRKSVLEFLDDLRPGDVVVLELSSFQLADLAPLGKSPHIAVFTSIYRDHLNWHRTMADYIKAKKVIFQFQKPTDYLFANPDAAIKKIVAKAPSRVLFPKIPRQFKKIVDDNLGLHYESSVALACAVAGHFGVSAEKMKDILEKFRGLEGRGQEIARAGGVRFINDTTATTPDAAIAALRRFTRELEKGRRLILVAGGQDKKLKFEEFARAIRMHADAVIFLPGTATDKIFLKVKSKKSKISVAEAQSMKEAVAMARRAAQSGDIVLLSPGAASFGLFLNEFDRGDQFTNEVRKLQALNPKS